MRRLLTIIFLVCSFSLYAQELSQSIRLNQVGFYPQGPKIAIVVDTADTTFFVTTPDLADTVFAGTLTAPKTWAASSEVARKADFTALTTPGEYVLLVPGLGYSYPFEIKDYVHQRVALWSLKSYYFQRMSIELTEEYAGKWKRRLGHPDTTVYVHPSAATEARPADTIIKSPRGWYDAGDYNKYIVNSGISTYTTLQVYENYPDYCKSLKTYIPESDDAMPDILDEALWNIRWMLTMQDPNDGGVYHKCTNANFDGFVMPHAATSRRYVVQKSSAAAFDFAAVMAQSARIFREFEAEMPGFADSCLTAAVAAWQWGVANPSIRYRQSEINAAFNPDINTGEYGDSNMQDEMDWAAMELFVTTGADSFLNAVNPFAGDTRLPSWPNVRTLGYYSLLQHADNLPDAFDKEALRNRIITFANGLLSGVDNTPYNIVMGKSNSDFGWGSNANAANQSIALLMAYRLTGEVKYLNGAIHNLDYLLGRNATGYCFLTGFGSKSPMKIHHRPSGADGVKDPVPGLLAGGPNPGQEDGVNYPFDQPAKSYVDVEASYASNEICINWNAPLVYAACAVEAIMAENGTAGGTHVKTAAAQAPQQFTLLPNFPNPFNATTTIRFEIKNDSRIDLGIYNTRGQRVATLLEGFRAAGRHNVVWDASGFATGVYFCRLQADGVSQQQKLVYVR